MRMTRMRRTLVSNRTGCKMEFDENRTDSNGIESCLTQQVDNLCIKKSEEVEVIHCSRMRHSEYVPDT